MTVMLSDLRHFRLVVLARLGVNAPRSTQPLHWQSSPRQSPCRWWMLRRHTLASMITESQSPRDQEYHPDDIQTSAKSRAARKTSEKVTASAETEPWHMCEICNCSGPRPCPALTRTSPWRCAVANMAHHVFRPRARPWN